MILNYTSSVGPDGSNRIRSYSQRLLSPIMSANSKESSLVKLFLSDLTKQHREKTIVFTIKKKELALKIIKGFSSSTNSRTELAYATPLGPGYYDTPTPGPSSPSIQFSISPRIIFDSNSASSRPKQLEIISSNRNLARHHPEIKSQELQLKSQVKQEKIEKVISNKKKLLKAKKTKIQEKIEEKKKKFLRVKQKEFYIQLEITWFSMICVCTASKSIFQYIQSQKVRIIQNLHFRARRLLKVFCILTRAIGVFLGKVWKFRKNLAKRKLLKLVGVIKLWVKNRRSRYRYICLNLLEKATNKDRLNKLLYKWKSKVVFIQRKFRQILLENKITWSFRLLSWNLAEGKVSSRRKSKAFTKLVGNNSIKRKSRISLKERAFSTVIVPQEVKCFFIKDFFRNKVKEFIKELNRYRVTCKVMAEEYKNNWYLREAAIARGETKFCELILPDKPKPDYHLNEGEMKKIVNLAFEKIDTWEGIVKESEGRKRKVRFRF